MGLLRLFRGFRMQTRKNCQPQSHPSVLECSKGNFRLNIQALRNSAFLLIYKEATYGDKSDCFVHVLRKAEILCKRQRNLLRRLLKLKQAETFR